MYVTDGIFIKLVLLCTVGAMIHYSTHHCPKNIRILHYSTMTTQCFHENNHINNFTSDIIDKLLELTEVQNNHIYLLEDRFTYNRGSHLKMRLPKCNTMLTKFNVSFIWNKKTLPGTDPR